MTFLFSCLPDLRVALKEEANHALSNLYSVNSWKTRNSQWNKYFAFCADTALPVFPATVATLCMFISYLSRSLKYNSICNYLSAVKVLHQLHGYNTAPFEDYIVKATIKGFRRILGDCPQGKQPIMLDILQKIVSISESVTDSGFIAALLTGFYSLMRKSSMLPKSISTFVPGQTVCRGSFAISKNRVIIKLTKTKTIQFKERCLYIPIFRNSKNEVCAVTALQSHFKLFPANNLDPAFYFIAKNGSSKVITGDIFNCWLKEKVKLLGLDPSEFSCHSLRKGGATFLHNSGASLELVSSMGDWSSLAVLIYLSRPFDTRLRAAAKLAAAVDSAH